MQRTEEQKITQAPIEVTLGTTVYPIKPLNILKARKWRILLNEKLGAISDSFQQKQGLISTGLAQALTQFPDKLAELMFAYAPELPSDKILDEATEEQIADAFQAIMVVAYPFLMPLMMVTKVMLPTSQQ